MSNEYFKFKQFTIYHEKCAMKVGTDGVLLGAWTKVDEVQRVLDIGTGTGIISIMLAQKGARDILAVDIDDGAVAQAQDNINKTKWADCIRVQRMDVSQKVEYQDMEGCFDAIVSNPPYFKERVKSPVEKRHIARHTESLSFEALLEAVACLLRDGGLFSVILPADIAPDFIALSLNYGLKLCRQTWVHTKVDKAPKRVMMTFVKGVSFQTDVDHLYMINQDGNRNEKYEELVKNFYLDK